MLPTLQTQLAASAAPGAMGQTMSAMLAQNDHLTGRARVVLTVSSIAQATSGSSGGAAARHEAAGCVRINGALQAAAEAFGADPAAREELAWLGQLQQAASKDEGESDSPALREAATAAVTGQFGAHISLLIHQEKLDAPR